ncbi:PucR family transcriptional regulator [Kibdelosporangium phytohabitans]|uniref:Uncharacterized protein n=1 Tax=Kibdelosporangium phytohabitans TaxID=860235 RepID=A0A0N9I615_9PSEU|nr:PucR family transcriptional regulator [Kibdelosporangium phytohabitans]ALG10027.1 hypothetical protein AOZ06_26820 [Kibdelosporangium phytohabitans]MBE1460993.1 hypothetical protein [Kibdelosporangium phytohabitans]
MAVPGQSRTTDLWAKVPADAARQFQSHADPLARAILREVGRSVPEYSHALDGDFGRAFVQGVHVAVERCATAIGSAASPPDNTDLFRELGAQAYAAGHSLEALLGAYRAAARASWSYVSTFCRTIRLPADVLCVIGEAIHVHSDEASALSAAGYAAGSVRMRQEKRDHLLHLLFTEPATPPDTVAWLAKAAEWTVPSTVHAVALDHNAGSQPSAPALPDDVLSHFDGKNSRALTACPERLTEVDLGRWRAAVGPRVALTEAATSLRYARRTVELARSGAIEGAPVLWVSDHLTTLMLHNESVLLAACAEESLGPLRGLTDRQRERLSETLSAWLRTGGKTLKMAEYLGIHPQTVRYRVSRLEVLFGDRMTDPAERMNLLLALQAT